MILHILTIITISTIILNMFWQPRMGESYNQEPTKPQSDSLGTKLLNGNRVLAHELPSSTQYLRKTTIKVPEAVADSIPEIGTLRIGYDVQLSRIYLLLVPRNGSGQKEIAGLNVVYSKDELDLVNQAKSLARNETWQINMLETYLSNH